MKLLEKMEQVKTVGEEVKKQGEEYDLLMDQMYQSIQSLKKYWTGDQADYIVFMERVAKEENSMRMVGKIIQEYGQLLEDISENTNILGDSIQMTIGKV